MDLVEKLVTAMNEELPIVTIDSFEIGETLSTEREPGNSKDK